MAGCKLIVVTGLDGDSSQFEKTFPIHPYKIFRYSQQLFFKENRKNLISEIEKIDSSVILFGWSIGAALSLSVADTYNVKIIISINSFDDRKFELERRNIMIPDEDNVIVTDYKCQGKKIMFVCGLCDTKISQCNTRRLYDKFSHDNDAELIEDPEMSHELISMSKGTAVYLTNILRNKLWTGC